VPPGHLPLTGLDVPDAEGVPLGAQSRPQPALDDDVVEVVLLVAGAPAAAEEDVVVVELDEAGEVVELEAVEALEPVVVLDVVWFVEVTEPGAVPVVCPPPDPPQPAVTRTRTSAATIRDTKRISVEPLGFTAGPRALRARA
jgi:hypothetical protein